LLDQELKMAGLKADKIEGYKNQVQRHLDVGLEILAGRADVGLGIHAVAGLLDLDFVPLRWERYDLMIFKERFFKASVQHFLGLLHEPEFFKIAESLKGYDTGLSGRMLFPNKDMEEPDLTASSERREG
jgi:molybdate-binding protein